jgi:biopolymer transport protein ExbD
VSLKHIKLFVLSFFVLLACSSQPQVETRQGQKTQPSITQTEPKETISLPQSSRTKPLPTALAIRLTPRTISVNEKLVSENSEALIYVNANSRYSSPIVISALAEELEIQKQIVLAEQGKEKFDRRALLYADKDTPARLVWTALFSAAAVGFDKPSLVVTDAVGAPAALDLTGPADGLLRGVFLEPDGAAPPAFNNDPRAPATTLENANKGSNGYQFSGAELVEEKAIIKGKLNKDIVRRVLRRSTYALKFCYEKALLIDPNLVGRVKILFVVARDGNVSSSTPQGIGVSQEVDNCVAQKIGQLAFPAPVGGGTVEITYSMVFQTPGNEFNGTNGTGSLASSTQLAPVEPIVLSFTEKTITLNTWPSAVLLAKLPPKEGAYDLDGLYQQLTQQQEKNPSAHEVILWWDGDSSYQTMLRVADVCMKAGLSAISLPPPSRYIP